ncbi:hypothetical protein [Luteolibacter sp. Populi]|uniref:hypothetical protein n=1 Tax=Luteolibacter sp. Populi TaxID=3230487 RepID=UPI0034663286
MEHLAISSDWLPIDRWISEALDQSLPIDPIENDLVDCTLFWSTKHSLKGASSRDSLAKSLEAVRILVSLGIEYPAAEPGSNKTGELRIRDLFKSPFTKLRDLKTPTRVETILGMDADHADLGAYWSSEGKALIDGRLYAQVRNNYERALASATEKREKLSLLKRLIKLTGVPLQMDEVQESDEFFDISAYIRTILAIHLNRIQRPSKLRKTTAFSLDSAFKGFEPLTKSELKTIYGNASLTPKKTADINREHAEISQRLGISPREMEVIGFQGGEAWTEYVLRIKTLALREAEDRGIPEPLLFFESHFVCEAEILIPETESDEEILETLQSIFTEADIEFTGSDLVKRSGMQRADLERILKQGEKLNYLAVRKIASKKLYSLLRLGPTEL